MFQTEPQVSFDCQKTVHQYCWRFYRYLSDFYLILILTVRLYIILNNKYCLRKQQLIIGSIVAEELREVVLIENQFIFGCVVFY